MGNVHIELDEQTYASLCGDPGPRVPATQVNDANCHRCREIFTTPLGSDPQAALRKLKRELDGLRATNAKKYDKLLQSGRIPAPHAVLNARFEALLDTLGLSEVQRMEFEAGFETKMSTVLSESLDDARQAQILDGVKPSASGLILPG